eukprot:gnl/TRDRNA2_/TRDRNA2_81165_c1_seq1.p1 gnl/TRDRNA2_/TRDRNA2_81165_c1~~gnl/TRDRNA2_/TRDRNA2_81165_c1_seq1.p1  ORF type:complete len:324 (-),score=41.45 gnl/TRDRNA2_/TRDRNA2_81165_c1_seq1:52-960(-)
MVFNGQAMRVKDPLPAEKSSGSESRSTEGSPSSSAEPTQAGGGSSWGELAIFFTVSVVVVLQAGGVTAVQTLWPLYVTQQFGWADREYAWLSLLGSFSSIVAMCAMPTCAQHIGAPVVATVLCAVSAVSVVAGFPAEAIVPIHIVAALAFMGSTAALKPCLQALASLCISARQQGRAFAILSLCNAIGQMLGSSVGTRLFDQSNVVLSEAVPPSMWRTHGGALPFIITGAGLFASTSALAVTLLPQHWKSKSDSCRLESTDSESKPMDATLETAQKAPQQDSEVEMASLLRQHIKPRAPFDE